MVLDVENEQDIADIGTQVGQVQVEAALGIDDLNVFPEFFFFGGVYLGNRMQGSNNDMGQEGPMRRSKKTYK